MIYDFHNRYTVLPLAFLGLIILSLLICRPVPAEAQGIAPEQIFQSTLRMKDLIGSWEALLEHHPLEEKSVASDRKARTLLTLRRDGTSRLFDQANPTGTDGLWTLEDHLLQIKFKNQSQKTFFIYGIKMDFMVTRTPMKDGRDQLWSKIK